MEKLVPTKELLDAKLNSVALRRLGRNDEIGALAMFLSSDLGAYITGGAIPCDGGNGLNLQPVRYETYLAE